MTWYFSYGSNLSIEQMNARTGLNPATTPRRIARLPDYRLVFNMRGEDGQCYANIVPNGNGVLGMIYAVDAETLNKLDVFECGYHREAIAVVDADGVLIQAVAYIADSNPAETAGNPSAEYLQRILRGGRQHGLPDEYLREIAALAGSIDCPIPHTNQTADDADERG